MYGFLVLLLVWLPIKLVQLLYPALFPFTVLINHPAELLTFNIVYPILQVRLACRRYHAGATAGSLLGTCLSVRVSWMVVVLGCNRTASTLALPFVESPSFG
jgi:hypothetical protein